MLKKHVEGRNTTWVVDLNKQVDDFPLYMDATRIIEDAMRRDEKCGYSPAYGPNFGIEARRAEEYVSYVMPFLNRENFLKFDTRNYRFFLGSVPVSRFPTPTSIASTGE